MLTFRANKCYVPTSSKKRFPTLFFIGLMVMLRGELVYYGRGGSVSGYRAEALFERESKTGVIVLRNVGGGKFNVAGLALSALQAIGAAGPAARTG